jgi:REP element-mobilizing transposase RayT
MKLNELGHIAYNMWMEMPGRYPIRLDVFQIMPNHIHAIIIVGAPLAGARLNIANTGAGASPAPTIGDVIGAYKSMVANECLKWFKSKDTFMGKIWQRNYYEHIIRDDAELDRIREYIAGNPARWAMDEENPNRMECEQQSQARLM